MNAAVDELREAARKALNTPSGMLKVKALDVLVLIALVRDLVDADDCWYDHHGYCQAHSLHERPCPHERAKDLLTAESVDE